MAEYSCEERMAQLAQSTRVDFISFLPKVIRSEGRFFFSLSRIRSIVFVSPKSSRETECHSQFSGQILEAECHSQFSGQILEAECHSQIQLTNPRI